MVSLELEARGVSHVTQIFMAREGHLLHPDPQIDAFWYENWMVLKNDC